MLVSEGERNMTLNDAGPDGSMIDTMNLIFPVKHQALKKVSHSEKL